MKILNRRCAPRRGVAAVELAITLPFLLVLLIGIWEVGRMIEVKQVIGNAAREGGRMASRGTLTNAEVLAGVRQYLQNAGLNTANVTCTVVKLDSAGASVPVEMNDPSVIQLDKIRVSVTIPFRDVRWLALNYFMPESSTITSTVMWQSVRDLPVTIGDPSLSPD